MTTNNIAADQTRLTIQIPKIWRATLDEIAEEQGFSSVGEVIQAALEDRYFGKKKLEPDSLVELRKALEQGFRAAVEYLEKEDKPFYQVLAEAHDKYGDDFEITVEPIVPQRKKRRKKNGND